MKKLHLICNAHLDPIWQWEWEEGAAAAISTFQSAVNLAKEFDYIFCHNEVTLYKYVEEYAPALFKEIEALVKEGRWRIIGGWYLQPDCLLPAGESMVRQIRAGERYFMDKFGVKPTTAFNVDAFGHSRGIVQIMKKCGQDSYLFVRPFGPHIKGFHRGRPQCELPDEVFLWEGYDGSVVKAFRSSAYASGLGLAREKIETDIRNFNGYEVGASLWGVGNHGGGPSRKDLADIQALMKESDVEIVHSYPEKFFEEVEPKQTFSGSLVSCMPGCYTSMIGLKQKYTALETQLYFTEKLASMAALRCGAEYPTAQFSEVVEDMLNVQFHDVLPGTVIKEGEENGLQYLMHGMSLLNRIRANAFFALCRGQKVAAEGEYPIMVFNPKPYRSKQLVECELSIIPTEHFEEAYSVLKIFDERGNVLPSQTVKEGSTISIDWRKKVVFEAELEPMSVTRFSARTEVVPNKTYETNTDIFFDNGRMQVKIGKDSGLIESYAVDGKEYANGKMFQPFYYDDNPDPWGMSYEQTFNGLGENPVAAELLKTPDGVFKGLQSIEIIEDGDLYLEAEAFFGAGKTRIRIGYKLYKKQTFVDVTVNVFPCEINKMLKLHIPTAGGKYIGGQMFGTEELFEGGRECFSQRFTAVCDGEDCLEIASDGTFGSSYKDGTVAISLMRSVGYCAHPVENRPLMRENVFIPKIDQGQRDYRFRLLATNRESLRENAELFIEKPYALNVFPTVDESTDNGFVFETDNPEISLVTVKKAEMANGYVVRAFNDSEKEKSARIRVGDLELEANFKKYEVKTFVYDGAIKEIGEMIV